VPFAAYPSVVVYKTPGEKSKRNAVTHLIWGDLIKELGPREGDWVKIYSRRKFGWIHKRDLQENRNLAKQLDLAEKESDKEAIRKKLEKKMEELERSIAVYGMINVRTDGEKAIVAQKLERPRSNAEKWDIYELEPGADGRLSYQGR